MRNFYENYLRDDLVGVYSREFRSFHYIEIINETYKTRYKIVGRELKLKGGQGGSFDEDGRRI